MTKYTVEICLRNSKTISGNYIKLPHRIYRHVEANNAVAAEQKAILVIDPNLEIESVQVIDR